MYLNIPRGSFLSEEKKHSLFLHLNSLWLTYSPNSQTPLGNATRASEGAALLKIMRTFLHSILFKKKQNPEVLQMSITEDWISELMPILFLLLLFSACVRECICVCTVCVCVCVCARSRSMCHSMHGRSENNSQELVLPFHPSHHVGPRDQTKAIRLVSSTFLCQTILPALNCVLVFPSTLLQQGEQGLTLNPWTLLPHANAKPTKKLETKSSLPRFV